MALRSAKNDGLRVPASAKVEPWIGKTWVNFFNSLRAITETDPIDEHGLRRAFQWAGNSAATAMKNYALVRKSDFQDIRTAGKSDAKCAAIDASDAKCGAESASIVEQKPHKKSTVENGRSLPCITVGVEGLEQSWKTRAKPPTSKNLTPNAPLSADEAQVVWLFRQLSAQDQERLIQQLRGGELS